MQISGSHSKPNKALKKSIESISGKQWDMEQVQVPQQNEGESCGYRMLSNLIKVIKGPKIQWEKDKERNRLHYYLYRKITQTFKDNQIKRKQKGKRKTREEQEEQEEVEEEQGQQRQKRNKKDNTENKKRKQISQRNKEPERERKEKEEKNTKSKKEGKKERSSKDRREKSSAIALDLALIGMAGLEWRTCSPTRS